MTSPWPAGERPRRQERHRKLDVPQIDLEQSADDLRVGLGQIVGAPKILDAPDVQPDRTVC
jgi:hypothetical protein